MRKYAAIIAMLVIATMGLTGCASTSDKELYAIYQDIRPTIVELREQIKADPTIVPPNILEKLKKIDPYLPALDALASGLDKPGFSIPPEVRTLIRGLAVDFITAELKNRAGGGGGGQ